MLIKWIICVIIGEVVINGVIAQKPMRTVNSIYKIKTLVSFVLILTYCLTNLQHHFSSQQK